MDEKLTEIEFERLPKLHIHVVGRTVYRTAMVKDVLFTCDRDSDRIQFLEEQLSSPDNHVVLIFQILYSKFAGTYYAFLSDNWCQVAKEIIYKEF